MSVWSANRRGWIYAARRVFDDPYEANQDQAFRDRIGQYDLLWSYYNNSMFDRQMFVSPAVNRPIAPWQIYKSRYNLNRNMRMIYNPTKRLVDFYADVVYPGVLSEDGSKLPDGIALAIPFSDDTNPALKTAVAQLWEWSNWQAKKAVLVRYGGALGSVLVEIIDDVEGGKVTMDVTWPGLLNNLSLDAAGNVKNYVLEYPAIDEQGEYVYRKEVDAKSVRYFRDDKPYDYGQGAVVANVYGFAPAVWIKHKDVGGIHGSPAISGDMGKVDELNNLASRVSDQVHKIVGAPLVLWSDGSVTNLFNTQKRQPTQEFEQPMAEQEQVLILKGPAGGSIDSLVGDLDLAGVGGHMDRILTELEKDYPELTFWDALRSMSQITGPAADRLMGDVVLRVTGVQATYDTHSKRLFQMAVAIAGMRANSGDWGPLNRQQQKFLPFDLDSYAAGDLDMAIMPRPLVKPTKAELASERQTMWLGVQAAVAADVPLKFALREEGFTDQELLQLGEDLATKIANDQAAATEDVVPARGQ